MAFDVLPARFGLGLNLTDAPESLEDAEARVLRDWRLTGRSRLSTRRAAQAMAGAYVGTIIGIFPFTHLANTGGVVLTLDGGSVRLYTVDGSGLNPVYQGNLAGWTGVAANVRVTATTLFRVLFIADEGQQHGLTCYDPQDVLGSGTPLFQPLLNLEYSEPADTPAASKMLVRGVAQHANMLLAWGHGSENEPSRPEVLRWSFIGLMNDGTGAGDAGYLDDDATATSPGSQHLFDREDATMVGERGVPIVAVGSGNGRAVVATAQKAYVLFGHDRGSFQLDEIDNQRGCIAARAMVEAAGAVYWMSPIGPCRYTGGHAVEDLARPILPLARRMHPTTIIAAHAPNENQVRFYYGETADGPATHVLAFDYRAGEWMQDVLGVPVRAVGYVVASGAEGPTAPPSALGHSGITQTQAIAGWTNGDVAAGVTTRIYRAPDNAGVAGAYQLVGTVGAGEAAFTLAGLAHSTTYWTKVEHVRNGLVSASTEASFTTLVPPPPPPDPGGGNPPPGSGEGTLAEPAYFHVLNDPVPSGGGWTASVLVGWTNGHPGANTEVARSTDGVVWTSVRKAPAGDTSWRDNNVVAGTLYHYRIRHYMGSTATSFWVGPLSVLPSDHGGWDL